jgi:hypothetical protein
MPELVAATTSADMLNFEYELSAANAMVAEKRAKISHLRRNPSMLTAIESTEAFSLSTSEKGVERYRVVVEVNKGEDVFDKLSSNSIRELVEDLR